MSLSERLAADWYAPRLTALTFALAPLAPLFALGAAARRALYRTRILRSQRLPVPVIVVGNVSVGGSGKTPLVAALCAALRRDGYHPGIVSRGYGGLRATDAPLVVTERTDVKLVRRRARAARRAPDFRSPLPRTGSRRGARCSPLTPNAMSSSPTTGCSTMRSRATSRSRSSTRRAASATAGGCRRGRCASRRGVSIRSTPSWCRATPRMSGFRCRRRSR